MRWRWRPDTLRELQRAYLIVFALIVTTALGAASLRAPTWLQIAIIGAWPVGGLVTLITIVIRNRDW